jgi:hypothetical protein
MCRLYNSYMIKPTQKFVKSLRVGGWGDYKHKLVAAGIMKSPSDTVPKEWQEVFLKVFRK